MKMKLLYDGITKPYGKRTIEILLEIYNKAWKKNK